MFSPRRLPWARVVLVAMYIAAVVAFVLSLPQYRKGRAPGYTELIVFGDQFESRRLPAVRQAFRVVHENSPGYDGQWYAQLAVDPLLRSPDLADALDNPQYRARRILFSWTAYVAGLGEPQRILRAYALQNAIAWLLLAAILLRWLPPTSPRHFFAWFGCLYGIGMTVSFRNALLEGPAIVLIALGVMALERGRPWLAAGLLGTVGLGRETSMMAATMLVDRLPRSGRDWRALVAKGLIVATPFFLWLAYIATVFPAVSVSNAASFSWPLSGYVQNWMVTAAELSADGWESFARFNVATMIGLTVQIGFLFWKRDWSNPWWRVGATYGLLMFVLSYPVWEGFPGAFPRVLLPVCIAFNILVPRSRWFWPLVVLGNLSVWHGIRMVGVPYLADIL